MIVFLHRRLLGGDDRRIRAWLERGSSRCGMVEIASYPKPTLHSARAEIKDFVFLDHAALPVYASERGFREIGARQVPGVIGGGAA
jgi:hypothetical protein